MIILKKTEKKVLAFGLTNKEFQCHCKFQECLFTIVSKKFLNAYDKFRTSINMFLHPTSGYRCVRHHFVNIYKKKNVTASQHLLGNAIDIDITNLLAQYHIGEIIQMAKDAGFTYVYYNEEKKFIHCDTR